jgi:hypothetical protein
MTKQFKNAFFAFIAIMLNQLSYAQVSGTVFKDYNGNGTRDATVTSTDLFLAGVVVNAYNQAGQLLVTTYGGGGSATDLATGSYSVTGATFGNVRLEFILPQSDIYATNGLTGKTTVIFPTAATNQNLAVNILGDYSQANPFFVVNKYYDQSVASATNIATLARFPLSYVVEADGNINGTTTGGGTTPFGQVTYSPAPPTPTTLATNAQIGATWGLAYDRRARKLYSAAYIKRGTRLGPTESTGAIYVTSDVGTPGAPSLYVDLNTVFGAGTCGVNPHPNGSTTWSSDVNTLDKVGKVGLGDLDISKDGTKLYVVNLANKKLYVIPTSGTLNNTTIESFDIPTTSLTVASNGTGGTTTATPADVRPFGIGIDRNGVVYVGAVHSAESVSSGANTDPNTGSFQMNAFVWSFNGSTFTQVLSAPLRFNRDNKNGYTTYDDGTTYSTDWEPWSNVDQNGNSQPMLSNIDFYDGRMILGFRDRGADQNHGVNSGGGFLSSGDIYVASPSGSNFVLESAGASGGLTGTGRTANSQGPGGGEFFEDTQGDYINNGGIGGIAILPGFGVISTTTDAVVRRTDGAFLENAGAAGVQVYNFTNGNYKSGYDIYFGNQSGAFAKASGLGDLEIILDAAPIEIGNRVWNDVNGNGIQDGGEAGIANVILELTNADGTAVDSDPVTAGVQPTYVTTDATGNWFITTNIGTDATGINYGVALLPNTNYIVKLNTNQTGNDWDATANGGAGGPRAGSNLAGFQLTIPNAVSNGVVDWSDNDATIVSAVPQISFTTGDYGANNHTLDMGFKQLASLGNRVWLDEGAGGGTRNNGVQDGTEPGVAGVPVNLYRNGTDGIPGTADDVLVASTITDAYGNYFFDNLTPTDQTNATTILQTSYNVRITTPSNYSITLRTNPTDDNNTTGGSTTGSDFNVLNYTYSINLSAGENNPNIDAGLVFTSPLINSIGDRVWLDNGAGALAGNGNQDAGEPGVAGVTVTLYDDVTGDIVAVTTTDANGNYLFNNLPANTNYKVGFSAPAGTVLTTGGTLSTGNGTTNSDPNPTTGLTTTINTGVAGTKITGVDAGLRNDPKGALGDFVWNDINNNGIQDAGEPGVPGVTMRLYGPGPDGLANGVGDVLLATTTTDANGYYVFPNLDPGKYFVVATPVSGYTNSTANQGTNDTKDTDFATGTGTYAGSYVSGVYTLEPTAGGLTRDMTVDLGIHTNATIGSLNTLGDRVWNDLNNDGLQTAGEQGVPFVTVRLLSSTGTPVNNPATGKPYVVQTDANGNYKFVDLPDGNYIVEFANIPSGYSFTSQDASGTGAPGSGTDGTNDSDAKTSTGRTGIINLDAASASATGINLTNVDAGIVQGIPAGTASLGNRVWYDLNNNGLQDAGELGVNNVKVELLDAAGAVVNVPGTAIPYIVYTNALGEYLFTNLPAGDYTVRFSNVPTGYTSSTANTGANDAIDADASFTGTSAIATTTATTGVYTLKTGEDNLTVDMGIVPAAGTNSLGNFVWSDNNNDGIQTAGEPGVQGVTVRLFTNGADGLPGTADDVFVATTTTDSNGAYGFVGLPDGNYNVEFSNLPAGFKFTPQNVGASTAANGSDADAASGRTGTIALDPTSASATGISNPNVDAGLVNTRAALGNYVWIDSNGDGVQDASEKGVSGVTVILYAADGTTVVASTVTDADGRYYFGNLNPGTYVVGFETIPSNLSFTQQNTPGDNGNNTNSDADPTTGKTGQIVLVAGETDLTIDAGLKPDNFASVGDFVWLDKDGDGVQDAGEPGVPGVLVTLRDNLGNIVGTAITDGNGKYLITNIKPGTGFTVTFSNLPAGSSFTTQTSNVSTTDATLGSDANTTTGVTAAFDLTAGQYLPHVDAGLINVQLLPTKIASFTASPKGSEVVLNWDVTEQINVSSYEIEHSLNGQNFNTKVATVIANSNATALYQTLHTSPSNGLNYYRIKIINKDGSYSYSEIRKVNFGLKAEVNVYPNPANSYVNITVNGSLLNKQATVIIVSATGAIVKQFTTAKLSQTETIDIANLATGNYVVRIITNNEVINTAINVVK